MEKAIAKGKKTKFKNLPLFMIALPGIVYLLINNYVPMFGVFLAFKNYSLRKGVFGSDWCGLQNFEFLFKTKDAWIMTRNTILYNVLSWVVIGFIAYAFLNADTGFINKTILAGLGLNPVSWYSYTGAWPAILIIVNLWKNMGYQSIVYMASISGIDKSIYEAAAIDGATKMQQIFKITLPMLKPTVITLTLMSIGRIFYSDFGLFYQVPQNSGALFNVTQTIDTYVYRGLMELNDVGMSAAAGLYQSLVGFILVLVANAIVRKLDSDNALF